MTTHTFNDPQDPTKGGTWYDDYGGHICSWDWDAAAKTVTVIIRGLGSKRIDLSSIGEQLLAPGELRETLPQVALEAAQRIALEK